MSDSPDVILWRHGRTEWNAAGRFQGQLDSHLDDVGRRQVVRAAGQLARRRPSRVVSSDSLRALDTAAALGEVTGLEVTPDPRLREVDLGAWSGLTRSQVEERFPAEYATWLAGGDLARGGGETFAAVGERAALAAMEHHAPLEPDAGPLVLVTHGGTARSLVLAVVGLTEADRHCFDVLMNARWATLRRRGEQWRLVEYNVGDPGDEVTAPAF